MSRQAGVDIKHFFFNVETHTHCCTKHARQLGLASNFKSFYLHFLSIVGSASWYYHTLVYMVLGIEPCIPDPFCLLTEQLVYLCMYAVVWCIFVYMYICVCTSVCIRVEAKGQKGLSPLFERDSLSLNLKLND